MTETVDSQDINEIGKPDFTELSNTLANREDKGYNVVGWNGTNGELQAHVNDGVLCPATSFAVVAEGIARYKNTNPERSENTDSLRELSKILLKGSEVFAQAYMVDGNSLKDQIRKYVESHGGLFDNETDWEAFIKDRADKLKTKADAIDQANK